jgi:type I restriction enzyme, S subunit
MSWSSYPNLTATEADWLGDLPSHWKLDRFRYIFRESDERNGHRIVGDMLAISGYRGVEVKQYDSEEQKRSDDDLAKYRVVRVGQLAVNTMWLNYCGLGVSKFEGHMSPDYKAYWIRPRYNQDYLNYLLRSDAYVAGYTKYLTGVRPNSLRIDRDSLMSLPIVTPPLKEQQQIARFLDRETATIDALIAKQEQLIATLREDRTATIAHGVAKGLDSATRMKKSELEWVDFVPSTWQLVPLKSAISFQEGPGIMATDFRDEGVPLLRVASVSGTRATLDGCNYLDPEKVRTTWSRFRVKAGDLLISASASMGTVAEAGPDVAGAIPYTGIIRIFPGSLVKRDFMKWYLVSLPFTTQIDLVKQGSTIQHYGPTHLSRMRLYVPPFDEQDEIVEFLNERCRKIDALIAKAKEVIERIREYRSALITDAVTGKIDVRGAA